jgi:DNA-binding response OmpR family regulator
MGKSDKHILIFEKDRNFSTVITRILKSEGYEVETTWFHLAECEKQIG